MHSRRRCNCRPSRQYTNYNNMSYRVETLDFSVSPKDLMPEQRRSQKEPRQTYVAYYKKKYTITIKDLDQPLFMVRQRGEKIYLVPELCVTTVSAMERLSLTHPSSTNGAPSRFEIIVLISPPLAPCRTSTPLRERCCPGSAPKHRPISTSPSRDSWPSCRRQAASHSRLCRRGHHSSHKSQLACQKHVLFTLKATCVHFPHHCCLLSRALRRRVSQNFGISFEPTLMQIKHIAEELDLPMIGIVGRLNTNALTEKNAFERTGNRLNRTHFLNPPSGTPFSVNYFSANAKRCGRFRNGDRAHGFRKGQRKN